MNLKTLIFNRLFIWTNYKHAYLCRVIFLIITNGKFTRKQLKA